MESLAQQVTTAVSTAPIASTTATATATAIASGITTALTTAVALTGTDQITATATALTEATRAAKAAAAAAAIAESRHVIAIRMPQFVQWLWVWQPTFMQGFILGQFSMLVLLVMAIKYILFEEPLGAHSDKKRADDEDITTTAANGSQASKSGGTTVVQEGGFGLSKFMIFSRKPKEAKPDDLAEELNKMHKEILSRTSYDLLSHAPESCDWLTVFLAQIIAKFRADAERHDRLVRVISEALNGELRPSVIDSIRITQFSLGSDFLRILSARMVPSSGSLGMRAELDLALHDEITLGFNTRVLVNWPRPSVAALPVSMVVSLVKFTGTMAIEFDSASLEPSVSVAILPDYVLEFDVQTLVGSKAKVQNLPMLTSVISRKLQAAFAKELVMPNEKRIKIKHPFTPKPPPAAAPGNQQGTPSHTAAALHPSNMVARPATAENNRANSPQGPPVADLPPDYNTQLPPPHPKRTGVLSRAGNPNSSPPMGVPVSMPPRMFTPEEPPMLFGHSAMRAPNNPQQPWSAAPSVYGMSPQLRPIVGLSSSTSMGATAVNVPRLFSSGSRAGGSYNSLLHTPGLGAATLLNSSSHHQPSAPSAARASEADGDELQVKDSVRQRVNRVIRTVNES